MAGIEKVCEFSGDYHGWLMYDYKRNLLQVNPRYRKYFKDSGKCTLYIYTKKFEKRDGKYWDGCISYGNNNSREFYYTLHLPELPNKLKDVNLVDEEGNTFTVTRTYWHNWSYDKRAFTHKIANLLGLKSVRDLNIVELNYKDFYDKMDEL